MFDPSYLVLNAGMGLALGDMIVQLVAFLILIALVTKFAWRPLMNVMENRENHIANEIDQAENNRKESERLLKEAQDELKNTRQSASKIIEDAKLTAQNQQDSILEEARQEALRLKENARTEIEQEIDKAVKQLQDQVATLSVQIASKVIEKELSADEQDELIKEYLNKVGENK